MVESELVDNLTPVVRLSQIYKYYGAGETLVKAVDGISLDIYSGEYVAIMGTSGSGKSTLMNIIGCLDIPTKGEYELDGINVSNLDENALAIVRNRKIGFVFQSKISICRKRSQFITSGIVKIGWHRTIVVIMAK